MDILYFIIGLVGIWCFFHQFYIYAERYLKWRDETREEYLDSLRSRYD